MSSLPSQHPTLSIHLTDSTPSSSDNIVFLPNQPRGSHIPRGGIPFFAGPPYKEHTLVGPQHMMVEYPDRGAVVLQSYMDPRDLDLGASKQAERGGSGSGGADEAKETVPALVGIVVAKSRDDLGEARRAMRRLERVGRDFQRSWAGEEE